MLEFYVKLNDKEVQLRDAISLGKRVWVGVRNVFLNSISASQGRMKENLVNVWALHIPTPFLPLSHHGLLLVVNVLQPRAHKGIEPSTLIDHCIPGKIHNPYYK